MTAATDLAPDPGAIARLGRWLEARGIGTGQVEAVRRLGGGRSNLTFAVGTPHGAVVVRRPPHGELLATAHDVLREARIMAAVRPVGVPAPAVLATCEDPQVIGAPFAVLDLVEGVVIRDRATAADTEPGVRAASGLALVDALAALHQAPPADLGLADLARPGSYVERQLRRWAAQWDATRPPRPLPVMEEVQEALAARLPEQQRTALVHSDPKLDNCILTADGRLAALVDWELATVGDPLADLALLLAYWAEPTDARHVLQSPPTTEPGFATRAELVARYAASCPLDLEPLPYYLAFSYWKLACIVAGVHDRLVRGALGADAPEAGAYAAQVVRLAELAHDALTSP